MFWLGQLLSAIGGLIGITTIRNWIRSRLPKIHDWWFDAAMIALIFVGLFISGGIQSQSTKEISRLEQRTKYRVLNPSPETVALLRKGPHGQVFLYLDPVDTFTGEYAYQWAKLLQDTGWEAECCLFSSDSGIPPGVTLLVPKTKDPAPYALHLRDVLAKSGLPVVIAPPGPSLSNDKKNDYSTLDVVLFIGRKPE